MALCARRSARFPIFQAPQASARLSNTPAVQSFRDFQILDSSGSLTRFSSSQPPLSTASRRFFCSQTSSSEPPKQSNSSSRSSATFRSGDRKSSERESRPRSTISQREDRQDVSTGDSFPIQFKPSEVDILTPTVNRWEMLRKDYLETNNEGLGFDPEVMDMKVAADDVIRESDKEIIQDLVVSEPELVDDYLKVVDQRRIRREFFWQNRAAISQRLKYDRLKTEIQEIRDRIEARNQGQEKKFFGIQDVIQILGADPANAMAVYDISSVSNVNDYEVVVTAASVRHMRHISYTLYKMAKTIGVSSADPDVVKIQGRDSDEWVLVDCGDVMVHFFLEHSRQTHGIERRWAEHRVSPDKFGELEDSHLKKCTVMVHVGEDSLWDEDYGSDWELDD